MTDRYLPESTLNPSLALRAATLGRSKEPESSIETPILKKRSLAKGSY